MASRYEAEVTVASGRDLKNVNWRYGDLRPYAVVWIDPASKCSTKVSLDGDDANPVWDEKLRIPLPYGARIEDSTLFIDVVHAKDRAEEDTKPLIGSARLPLREVLDEAGIGGKVTRSLKLKRPSGRPHGKLEVKVAIKEPERYYDPYAQPYGQTTSGSRDYPAPPAPYGQPPQYGYGQPYGVTAPPAGYPYSAPPAYGAPPPVYGAPLPAYGGPPSAYGSSEGYGAPPVVVGEKKKSKFGMGTGLAVGAAAGLLGGLALAEGIDYVEDKIEDNVAERVEDDLAYDDAGGYDDF